MKPVIKYKEDASTITFKGEKPFEFVVLAKSQVKRLGLEGALVYQKELKEKLGFTSNTSYKFISSLLEL